MPIPRWKQIRLASIILCAALVAAPFFVRCRVRRRLERISRPKWPTSDAAIEDHGRIDYRIATGGNVWRRRVQEGLGNRFRNCCAT